MSARISRAALALFALLAAAVSVNLTVMQPLTRMQAVSRAENWGQVDETAALAIPEIDTRRAGAQSPANEGPVAGGTAPVAPGVGQRVLVAPPGSDRAATTRAIQAALIAKGYETGGADGIAGPVTEAAILAYEIDNGLPLTAEPSDALLAQLNEGRRGPPAASGGKPGPKAEALIRSVQTALGKLGYKVGRADGRLGESTIAAIRSFEKQQSMPDTGRISGDLLTRLTRLAAPSRTAEKRSAAP
ncbi:MAG: peptidoglycan-binding protein [Hyphomicrobium sp.]|jgi:peptidoglycan hydrolase-like protein with peptidoglycan-binding domain|nr:peptidoglycan-binding protein [Hyphomicrobium sp.]